jgi:hypothetical protein
MNPKNPEAHGGVMRFIVACLITIICGFLGITGAQAQAPPKQAAPAPPAKTQESVKPPAQATTWKIYHNKQYGFSFEYPAIYDEPSYREACGLHLDDKPQDYFGFGRVKFSLGLCDRIYLAVYDAGGLSLEAYVKGALKKEDFSSESQKAISVNGVKGYQVDYRFGGMGRFGTMTFLKEHNNIFVFNLEAGGGNCEAPVSQWDAFDKMIDTFKFSGAKLKKYSKSIIQG